MNIEKKLLAKFDKLYAQCVIWRGGKPLLYLAASEKDGPCVSIDAETFEVKPVWDAPGGTMTICQLNDNGDFLAVQNFFPVFDAKNATIVYGKYENGSYRILPCAQLPYIHRFEIVKAGGVDYFVGGTLCSGKDFVQDWSKPGKVFIGAVPEDPTRGIAFTELLGGITKNHGLCKTMLDGREVVLVSGAEGLFLITPPERADGEWKTRKLMDREISDIAVVDFDNDGEDEIAVIEGFHGNRMTVNKRRGDEWREIYSYDMTLGHALWGGTLLGKKRVLVGYRREGNGMVLVTAGGNGVEELVVGNGGPSQYTVWEQDGKGMIYSADREAGEAVLYTLSE